jgi:hypothetical protein
MKKPTKAQIVAGLQLLAKIAALAAALAAADNGLSAVSKLLLSITS